MDSIPTAAASAPVRVALVNDYVLVVRGLEALLAPFAARVEVVELVADRPVEKPIDIALYDTFAFGQNTGPQPCQVSDSLLVVYSWPHQPELVTAAWKLGARGYISKTAAAAEIVDALERVHRGERQVQVLPAVPAPGPAPDDSDTAGGDWPARNILTARQSEVVALICQGYTNEEITQLTYLSPNTVKSYIREAYRRMGVTSRSQAVAWGLGHGMDARSERIPS